MLDEFGTQLNTLLVTTFRNILRVEEQSIKQIGTGDVTMAEMHLMESIAKKAEGATVTEIACDLGITSPSVTIGLNRLERKGYVYRERSVADARVVHAHLTDRGRQTNETHTQYHEQMIRRVAESLTPQERDMLSAGIVKLNTFFASALDQASVVAAPTNGAAHEL